MKRLISVLATTLIAHPLLSGCKNSGQSSDTLESPTQSSEQSSADPRSQIREYQRKIAAHMSSLSQSDLESVKTRALEIKADVARYDQATLIKKLDMYSRVLYATGEWQKFVQSNRKSPNEVSDFLYEYHFVREVLDDPSRPDFNPKYREDAFKRIFGRGGAQTEIELEQFMTLNDSLSIIAGYGPGVGVSVSAFSALMAGSGFVGFGYESIHDKIGRVFVGGVGLVIGGAILASSITANLLLENTQDLD